ncbi:MAG: DinB family protein [Lutibacter sp.]|nr:DinB family protein [Lutibacter sp.]MBP9600864.1 DinB family protein [Lutibacter sp.]
MIEAIDANLQRGIKLLHNISDTEYSDTTVAPYYSSIGTHIRHILDVFDCIFEGMESGNINLINRKRNEQAELETEMGILYFSEIMEKLHNLPQYDLNKIVKVTDDLGMGVVTANYTFIGILIQAHSHAIHHFASVGYVISQLGIQLPDPDFGYNPTTPKASH